MKEALNSLRAALEALASQQKTVKVFFRDDDVDEEEAALRKLLTLFAELEAPINLEIIPAQLTTEAIRLLREAQGRHPKGIELNQHGWQHVNHEPAGRKCEFGASRSFTEQLDDIAKGREVLEQAFGKAFSPVFTPPWNRCTEATYRALDQLGFLALSKLSGGEPVAGYTFRELSVTLDLFRWKGGAMMKAPDEFIRELTGQLQDMDTVGIMLHHKVMDENAFALIGKLVEELDRSEAVCLHTFQSLLAS